MNAQNPGINRIERLQNGLSTVIAAFMLCLLPLRFNNGYRDINTIKADTLIRWMPVLGGLYLLSCILNRRWPYHRLKERKGPLLLLGFLLLALILSAARTGFSPFVVWGIRGRYAGLYFLVCCIIGCFCLASGKCYDGVIQVLLALSGAVIAAVGFLNILGYDPLRFYADVPQEQRLTFLSTIGNINSFGCGLLFSLSAAAFMFVSGRHPILGGCLSAVIGLGICCSITDTALIGLLCSGPILLYRVWGSRKAMERALLYTLGCILLVPITRNLIIHGSLLYVEFPGLYAFIAQKYICMPLALLAGIACVYVHRISSLPARPRLWIVLVFILVIALLILCAGMGIGHLNYNGESLEEGEQAELNLFRLWGGRGFIYYACLRCYLDYPWQMKLFGCGIDSLEPVLEPYLVYRGERFLRPGDYLNDAHCQPLHYLLTCGFLGFAAFTGFYAAAILLLLRQRKNGAYSDAFLLALLLYLPTFLLNTAQPIMLILFFGAAGLGISAVEETRCTGGKLS